MEDPDLGRSSDEPVESGGLEPGDDEAPTSDEPAESGGLEENGD